MAWRDARGEIKTVLASVNITAPIVKAIAKVYETPPDSIEDDPCFVIYPPAIQEVIRAVSLRIKRYRVRLQLLLQDENKDRASDMVDSFREALVDAFDTKLTLVGKATQVTGPEVEEAAGFQYANETFTGFNAFLTVEIKEGVSFAG